MCITHTNIHTLDVAAEDFRNENFLITIKCNLTNYTVVSVPTEILNLDKTLPKFRFL